MATEPKNPATNEEDKRTEEEILRELGFSDGDLVLNVDGDAEEMATRIASRVKARLAAQGWSPADADLSDAENLDDEQEDEEDAGGGARHSSGQG